MAIRPRVSTLISKTKTQAGNAEGDAVHRLPLLSGALRGSDIDLTASGAWTSTHAGELEALVDQTLQETAGGKNISVDMSGVTAFDTFGAWLRERLVRTGSQAGKKAGVRGLRNEYQGLFDRLHGVNRDEKT